MTISIFAFGFIYSMQETVYTERGTFDYHILLNSEVKKTPIIAPLSKEVFYYSCGDGPKPPMQEVSYQSSESVELISTTLSEYLRDRGFQRRGNPNETIFFESDNNYANISFEHKDFSTSVSILFIWKI